jgi:hypothetical protein
MRQLPAINIDSMLPTERKSNFMTPSPGEATDARAAATQIIGARP